MLATWHWHIEISSKCTLKCARCARQEVPGSLINTELTLEFFQRNFTPDFIIDNVEKITFCGDDGDPIYAHDLIPVIKYFKSVKDIEIVIITNGSHKKVTWWEELGSTLTIKDSVHFSIDGYDDKSNNKYRTNSNFESIIQGLKTLRSSSGCTIIWATIGFSFNQDHIEQIKQYAKQLGVDKFQLTKSTKFGAIYPSYGIMDKLQPNKNLMSSSFRFERLITDFTNRVSEVLSINRLLYEKALSSGGDTVPLCEIGNKGLYIDARGRLFPCCWVANRYSHNSEWQELADHKFNLNLRKLTEILNDEFWENKFKAFGWTECRTKCNRSVTDQTYCTSW